MEQNEMSDLYDHTETFNARIKPLIEEIAEICDEHRLPFLINVVHRNDEEEYQFQTRAEFYGVERTPSTLLAAHAVLSDRALALGVIATLYEIVQEKQAQDEATLEA